MDNPNNQNPVQDQGVAPTVPADASVQPVVQPISQPVTQPTVAGEQVAEAPVAEVPGVTIENSQPGVTLPEAPQAAVGEQQPVEEVPAATGENQ